MTDTNTLAPADAEILDAAEDFRSQYTHGGTTFDEFDEIGFARAVLPKWGTPAPVGVEPVARLEIGKTKGGVSLTHIAEPAAFQLQEGMYALYTTPQPTQAAPPLAENGHLTQAGHDLLMEASLAGATLVSKGRLVGDTAQAADSVVEAAACWHWIAEYLVGTRTDLDDGIVASETVNDLRKLVDAARKQGGAA